MSHSNYTPRQSLGFRSAVIASLVLSVVSFLTTWSGLRAADPIQQLMTSGGSLEGISWWDRAESLAITLGLAFGIQALMLALAWIASRLLMVEDRKRWGLISAILVGYLAATTISVTFSYIDLFDRMFSAQKSDWSAETIRERGDVIVEELIEALEDEVRDARGDFSTQQAEFQAQINVLASASNEQRQSILTELDERRSELADYRRQVGNAQAEARSAAVSRQARAAELETTVADFERQVRQLTPEQDEWEAETARLLAQSQALSDQKLLEERGAQESGQVGRGPRWRELDRQHDIVRANLEVAQNRLSSVTRELDNAEEALLSSRQQLAIVQSGGDAQDVENALNAGNDVRIGFLEAEISALTAQSDALEIPQIDFSSEEISEDEVDQILTACTTIKSELIAAQATSFDEDTLADFEPSSIDCTSGGAFEAARTLSELQSSLRMVEENCRASSSEAYAGARGSELLQYIRNECVNSSALRASVKSNFMEDLRRVARTRDPEAAPIAYSFVALQDREPQAIFALTLALAADLLILLVSLFGNAGHHHVYGSGAGNGTAPPSRQIGRREPALFEDE